jgi:hypothetical protein
LSGLYVKVRFMCAYNNKLLRIYQRCIGCVKTNYIDKYDNEILNKYRIKTINGNIVKIMNGLHKKQKKNK